MSSHKNRRTLVFGPILVFLVTLAILLLAIVVPTNLSRTLAQESLEREQIVHHQNETLPLATTQEASCIPPPPRVYIPYVAGPPSLPTPSASTFLTATNCQATISTNGNLTIDLRRLAGDPDGDALSFGIISLPSHGSATLQNSILTYAPLPGFGGSDYIIYSAQDGHGGVASGQVNMTVVLPLPTETPTMTPTPTQAPTPTATPCPLTLVWSNGPAMPTGRWGLGAAAALNGVVYAIGGWNGTTLGNNEGFNPASGYWSTYKVMPTARYGLGVASSTNGKIYAIGGWDNTNLFATNEEYDPSTNTWATRASMPTARRYLGVTSTTEGLVWAIGGDDDSQGTEGIVKNTVEVYNPATDTWATYPPIPTARKWPAVAASNGKVYVIGGAVWNGQTDVYLTTVEAYDETAHTWAARASLPNLVSGAAAVSASNGLIYVIGGGDSNGALNSVYIYDPNSDSWKIGPSLPIASGTLGAALAANGEIYAVGGHNGCCSQLSNNQIATFNPSCQPNAASGDRRTSTSAWLRTD